VYVGFIEAPAAERACLDAIKTSSDPSRFQANLAGVYLQQGRFADALLLARTAAKRNAVNSSTVMADMYDHGLGVPLSPDKVIPLLLADVEWGSVWALDYLGDLLTSGRRVERSPALGLELYKLAASNGSAEAAFDAAGVYLAGNGVEADVPQALKILRAAGDGYPPVLNPLSRALRATPGSDPDESRRAIAKLFQQMEHFAALGSLTAKYRLGLIYTNGVGVSVDKEKGFSLLMEAAQAGDPNAAFSVANAYLNGTGTAPNQEKAIEFFRKAAASGILDAEIQLAKLTNSAR
jgi:TPR repeat protein